MRRSCPPFLTPSDSSISHRGWQMERDGDHVPLPPEMSHWDYQTKLQIVGTVTLNWESVLEQCALAPDSRLELLISAHSDHTRTERPVALIPINSDEQADIEVDFSLDGTELGGRLTLTTILASSDPKPLSPLSPQDPGSILWSTMHRTVLQNEGAQFPTDAVAFSIVEPEHERAAWRLNIDTSDPDARFLSSVRLTLNTDLESVMSLLAGIDDKPTTQLEQTLRWDVTRQLVLAGLALPEARALELDIEATSVAGVLRNIIASVWPTMSAEAVHQRLKKEPGRIEMDLQDHCGLVT